MRRWGGGAAERRGGGAARGGTYRQYERVVAARELGNLRLLGHHLGRHGRLESCRDLVVVVVVVVVVMVVMVG